MNDYKALINKIWGMKVAWHPDFPTAVVERVEYFIDEMDDGLSFTGALESVLAYHEHDQKELYEQGGSEWLPVSQEFKNWRDDNPSLYGLKEMAIALSLIYGATEVQIED